MWVIRGRGLLCTRWPCYCVASWDERGSRHLPQEMRAALRELKRTTQTLLGRNDVKWEELQTVQEAILKHAREPAPDITPERSFKEISEQAFFRQQINSAGAQRRFDAEHKPKVRVVSLDEIADRAAAEGRDPFAPPELIETEVEESVSRSRPT